MPAASRVWFVLYTIGSTAPPRAPVAGRRGARRKKAAPKKGVVDVERPVQSLSAHNDRRQNLYVAPTCANRPMYEYTDVSYPLWSSVPFAKIGSYGGVRLKRLLMPP